MILRVQNEDQDRFFQVRTVKITDIQIYATISDERELTLTKQAGDKITFNFMTDTGKPLRDPVVWR